MRIRKSLAALTLGAVPLVGMLAVPGPALAADMISGSVNCPSPANVVMEFAFRGNVSANEWHLDSGASGRTANFFANPGDPNTYIIKDWYTSISGHIGGNIIANGPYADIFSMNMRCYQA